MQAIMQNARLAYVVRKLDGQVERPKTVYSKDDGLKTVMRQEPAGYLVYFPRGHVLRLSEKQLKHYNLDKEPHIINMEGLYNPNSPLGRLLLSEDEGARQKSWKQLEEQCIRMATVNSGSQIMPEQHEAPKAKAR